MSVHDLTPRTFEECMSTLTMGIGQLERLATTLSPEQRDRVTAAAARLAATTQEPKCPA